MVDASNGESLADEDTYSEHRRRRPERQLRRRLRRHRRPDRPVRRHDRPGSAAVPRQRRDRTRGSDRGGQPGPRLRPGRDRHQQRPRRREAADRRRLEAARLAARPTRSPPSPRPTSASRFEEAIDQIDANGIPGEIPPANFKSGLKEAGHRPRKDRRLDRRPRRLRRRATAKAASPAPSCSNTKDAKEATNTVANIGLLLRATGTPGVTAISGKASGFSIRSADLGAEAAGHRRRGRTDRDRLRPAGGDAALATGRGPDPRRQPRLQGSRQRRSATPRSPASSTARRRCSSPRRLIPADEEEGFDEAKPYLEKIDYLAIGSGASGDLATAKLIVGLGK